MTAPILKGDIYNVDFPKQHTVGSEQHAIRPFIIVSIDALNNGSMFIGVPMTSTLYLACAHRIKIPVTEIIRDPSYHGKINDSVALTDQVRAFDKLRLADKVGRLTDAAIISVGLGLSFVLGI